MCELSRCVAGCALGLGLLARPALGAEEAPVIANVYPDYPGLSPDSLRVLLGGQPATAFTCPTCNADLQRLGLNYAWNQKVSGKRLSDLKDPATTWLAMDFVGTHDWMVAHGHCGHRRGVNILYADGTVKWSRPFSTEAWNKSAAQSWLQWSMLP